MIGWQQLHRMILALLFGLWMQQVVAQSLPAEADPFLNDYAELLSENQEEEVRAMLRELQQERDIVFKVLTITDMARYGHFGPIEPFATTLFNTWGIGDAQRNDGLLMLVSRDDRTLRIEVGSGYGTAQDAPMKRIIDKTIVPHFRGGDFPTGIKRGVEDVIYQLTGITPGHFNASRVTNGWITLKRTFGWFLALLFVPFGWVGWKSYTLAQRNYPRRCPNDGATMGRVLEEYEDSYLKPGQTTEEAIGSIDYDVWKCETCDHRIIEAYPKRGRRFGACRECGFKTAQSDTTVEQRATRQFTGIARVDYTCSHCQARYAVQTILPMLTDTDDSSFSGGGSSGGGSSSGGGASGSW